MFKRKPITSAQKNHAPLLAVLLRTSFIITFALTPATAAPAPVTEQANTASQHLDALSAFEIITLMNQEDLTVARAITPCLPEIARAVEHIAHALRHSGRLMYVGAGSSGRLGVLDASECPPTFSAPRGQVVGIIAGGDRALQEAVESVEDDGERGIRDLRALRLSSRDIVCGISASGSAQYVRRALAHAHDGGCFTIMVTCNPLCLSLPFVDCCIAPAVGPEVLTGSTRLKAGTATKMVLNMLSTGSFVMLGKVYKNYMVDLMPLNHKLMQRAVSIVEQVLEIDSAEAEKLLTASRRNVKTALVMHKLHLNYKDACALLRKHPYTPMRELIDGEEEK